MHADLGNSSDILSRSAAVYASSSSEPEFVSSCILSKKTLQVPAESGQLAGPQASDCTTDAIFTHATPSTRFAQPTLPALTVNGSHSTHQNMKSGPGTYAERLIEDDLFDKLQKTHSKGNRARSDAVIWGPLAKPSCHGGGLAGFCSSKLCGLVQQAAADSKRQLLCRQVVGRCEARVTNHWCPAVSY